MSDALKGYEHLYDDRWIIVRIFLCTFEEQIIYYVCKSDKWFIAMCYIGFVTYTGKFLSQFKLFCFELESGTIRWKKVP
jgi:hypothetical protein